MEEERGKSYLIGYRKTFLLITYQSNRLCCDGKYPPKHFSSLPPSDAKSCNKKNSVPEQWHVSTRPTSSPAMIPETLPPKSYTPTAQSTKAQPTCWSYIAGKAVLRKKVLCPRAQATPRLTQAGNRMQTCGEWSTKDKRAEGFARISGRWSA